MEYLYNVINLGGVAMGKSPKVGIPIIQVVARDRK